MEENSFCIQVDFQKESANPSRVFETMADLIESFNSLDKDLIDCVDLKIEPTMILEDIESGSIKTWVRNVINGIPDEAIKDLDWKKALGKYLIKSKYILINWLDGRTEITTKEEIQDIQYEILKAAEESDVKTFPNYTPIKPKLLTNNIQKINSSLSHLSSENKVKYISDEGEADLNIELNIAPEAIDDLITMDVIESSTTMILKVKKPDYLGESMWDLKHDNKPMHARIEDHEWLDSFQNRKFDLRPGDSIKAEVKTVVKYGYDHSIVDTTYIVTKVIDILENQDPNQNSLFE